MELSLPPTATAWGRYQCLRITMEELSNKLISTWYWAGTHSKSSWYLRLGSHSSDHTHKAPSSSEEHPNGNQRWVHVCQSRVHTVGSSLTAHCPLQPIT